MEKSSGLCRFSLKTKTSSPDTKTLSAVNHVKLIIYLNNGFSLYSGSHLQEMHELPWVKNWRFLHPWRRSQNGQIQAWIKLEHTPLSNNGTNKQINFEHVQHFLLLACVNENKRCSERSSKDVYLNKCFHNLREKNGIIKVIVNTWRTLANITILNSEKQTKMINNRAYKNIFRNRNTLYTYTLSEKTSLNDNFRVLKPLKAFGQLQHWGKKNSYTLFL